MNSQQPKRIILCRLALRLSYSLKSEMPIIQKFRLDSWGDFLFLTAVLVLFFAVSASAVIAIDIERNLKFVFTIPNFLLSYVISSVIGHFAGILQRLHH
jgi:hypothetical protein